MVVQLSFTPSFRHFVVPSKDINVYLQVCPDQGLLLSQPSAFHWEFANGACFSICMGGQAKVTNTSNYILMPSPDVSLFFGNT